MDYQAISEEMNKRVARMLGFEPRPVEFRFVPMIEHKQVFRDRQIIGREVKGRCLLPNGPIDIVPGENWGTALIHELIHFYNPHMRHPQVKRTVKDCIRYLKLTVGQSAHTPFLRV